VDLSAFETWARSAWQAVISDYTQNTTDAYKQHAWKHGCDVRRVHDHAHMSRYVSKYVAKDDENTLNGVSIGRRWGWFNRSELDFEPFYEVEFTREQYIEFRHWVRSWSMFYGRDKYMNFWRVLTDLRERGFSVFGLGDDPNDDTFINHIWYMLVDTLGVDYGKA
jgi:hypothetical protein